MIEKALVKRTSKSFWAWIIFLLALIAVGFAAYILPDDRRFRRHWYEQRYFLGHVHRSPHLLRWCGRRWCHDRFTVLSA